MLSIAVKAGEGGIYAEDPSHGGACHCCGHYGESPTGAQSVGEGLGFDHNGRH